MCTAIRFTSTDGELYFGRNCDWGVSFGEHPVAVPAGHLIEWTHLEPSESKHKIIGMGLVEGGFPSYFDAANDAGLAISDLYLPESTRFPEEPVEGKTNVTVGELPLWVTANFATVAEVKEALANAAIVCAPGASSLFTLHWIVADAQQSIVIESTERGLEVHDDDVDVITNEPDFQWHRTNLRNYILTTCEHPEPAHWGAADINPVGHGQGMLGIPGDYSPASRFVKAAYINTHYPAQESEEDNVVRAFRTLDSVAVPMGASAMEDGGWDTTFYQAAYSGKTHTYYYTRYNEFGLRSVCLDEVDFGGTTDLVEL